ncbi:hypothetical protein N8525_00830 [Verrucomicrobiales bacterium]|nr:hypothetical protein [Verrucomicrobiales bacterium]
MATGVATALDIDRYDAMTPTAWEEWQKLPIRDTEHAIGTVIGQVRVPTIIVLARYSRMPLKRPKFSSRAIRQRDGGRCQYTGRTWAQMKATSTTSCPVPEAA